MNLFEIFKQFKRIEPDPRFTDRSRRMILAAPQETAPAIRRGIPSVWSVLETGIALVLAGFFIVLVTGKFPGASYLSPVQYSVINPDTLHAEAQAIDMQIQLTDLNYTVPTSSSNTPKAAAPKAAAPLKTNSVHPNIASTLNSSTTATDTATSSTSTVSLDEALQQLSQ